MHTTSNTTHPLWRTDNLGKHELPSMMDMTGKELDPKEKQNIFSGEYELTVKGFCSDTAMNVIELDGDWLIAVHSIHLNWNQI